MEQKKWNYTKAYFISNICAFIMLYCLTIFLVVYYINISWLVKLVILLILLPIELIIEYNFLMRFVNGIVYFFFPRSIKDSIKEEEQKSRQKMEEVMKRGKWKT